MNSILSGLAAYNSLVIVLTEVNQQLERAVQSANLLGAAMERITGHQQLQAGLQRIAVLEEEIKKLQDELNNKVDEGANKVEDMVNAFKKVGAIIQAIIPTGAAAIAGAMSQDQIKAKFIARTGNKDAGSALYERLKQEIVASGGNVNESMKGIMALLPITKDAEFLSKLNDMAQRLAAFDPAGGGEAEAFSQLAEAMKGDMGALSGRFDLSALDELGKAPQNNPEAIIAAINKAMESSNMGQANYEMVMESPLQQLSALSNNFNTALSNAGTSAMEALAPVIAMLLDGFQAGKFQPFFDVLSIGLYNIIGLGAWLIEVAYNIYSFFASWGLVEPILWGIIIALVAWRAQSLYVAAAEGIKAFALGSSTAAMVIQQFTAYGLRAAWVALNQAMGKNIFILIAAAIIGLIIWLYNLWNTNDQFAAALMRAWNGIMNFVGLLVPFFWQLAVWMLTPFVWWAGSIGKVYDGVINSIIDGINSVLSIINLVTGSSYKIQAKFNMEDIAKDVLEFAENKKDEAFETAAKNAAERDAKVNKMISDRKAEQAAKEAESAAKKNPNDAYNEMNGPADAGAKASAGPGAGMGAGAGAGAGGGLGGGGMAGGGGNIARVDEVGSVGSIDEKVDISSEDLQMMRDLAEMNSIQNFVTLTPTVQVTTGPITKEMDVSDMLVKIEQAMEREITSSAERAYG
ncbi:hypothetical protein PAECIP111893_03515 [Paenibacillus plantiphilus]|uniref:Uncharacterized protein n=1 Tax=Paenibacillus plantiphilus TaxID=2905650 RepID=A0ABM9CHC5_9BACL|nr:hypothetical protein [Paenibacillus plantiphilus]CAH1212289.1 hypothetical protein PAECIP111893_03515 [Paenibacillus plantiphilus]